jgi:putative FmdB family regulatory protein
MPIHDFRCRTCGADFELLLRAGDTPVCPHCAGVELQRQVSLTAPQATSRATIARARRTAAREGHFCHYSKAERAKLGR